MVEPYRRDPNSQKRGTWSSGLGPPIDGTYQHAIAFLSQSGQRRCPMHLATYLVEVRRATSLRDVLFLNGTVLVREL